MKKIIIVILILFHNLSYSQTDGTLAAAALGVATITYVAETTSRKELAKEITQFRSKEFIVNYIIGPTNGKSIRFETESLASDNSGGLISVAFNCNEIGKKGLLLAFFGYNRDTNGYLINAYSFRYIPLDKAQKFLNRIDQVKRDNKDYMSGDKDVNNVYIEFEDIKFVLYKEGGEQIRVFWNGFEVIWEKVAFNRTKKRLNKWFD